MKSHIGNVDEFHFYVIINYVICQYLLFLKVMPLNWITDLYVLN